MKASLNLMLAFAFLTSPLYAQKILLEVELPKQRMEIDIPVSINLKTLPVSSELSFVLFEIKGSSKIEIPFQITRENERILHWLIKTESKGLKKRVYELTTGTPKEQHHVHADLNEQTLTIRTENKNFLRYHHAVAYPPKGIDSAYKRSGFIHPLWSPNGQVLTRIQPPDHYHHYGIWNPWTRVLYKGDTVDFWNIGGKKGTVRFSEFTHTTSGPVFAELQAIHEHVVMKDGASEEVAIRERQTIRVYKPEQNQCYYIIDFTFELACATETPVTFLEYRYGGLGWRATEQWHKDNSELIISEGKSRKEADGTKARWFIMQGETYNDYAGMAMMSHPANYNHPEPLRVWPDNQYDRGDVFVNYSPTKDKDWKLEPGKKYVLQYRFIVFNGRFTSEKIAHAWYYFYNPPEILVK